MLGVSEKVVAVWKQRDKWQNVVQQSTYENNANDVQQSQKRRRGAPKGNKNAVGNRGGGPPGNSKAVKHGFFRKHFPEDAVEIMQEIEARSPLDILWDNIVIQYTAIVRAQRIMYVRDQNDTTVTKVEEKNGNVIGERWEVQHAWDKQATFLQAQSRAMATLQNMIARYDELCRSELATEEQRLRIEKLKAEVKAITNDEDKELHIEIDYGDGADGKGAV